MIRDVNRVEPARIIIIILLCGNVKCGPVWRVHTFPGQRTGCEAAG
jgi:hypothetical protein